MNIIVDFQSKYHVNRTLYSCIQFKTQHYDLKTYFLKSFLCIPVFRLKLCVFAIKMRHPYIEWGTADTMSFATNYRMPSNSFYKSNITPSNVPVCNVNVISTIT